MINDLVATLNSLSAGWLAWSLSSLIDSCILLGIVGLIWLTVRKRVSPQVGYWLFFLVLLKLAIPLSVTVPRSLAGWSPSTMAIASLQRTIRSEPRPESVAIDESTVTRTHDSAPVAAPTELTDIPADAPPNLAPESIEAQTSELTPQRRSEHSEKSTATAGIRHPSLLTWIMLGWAGCVVCLSGRLVWRQIRFEKRLKQLRLSDSTALQVELDKLCQRMNVPRKVRLVLSDQVTTPAVCGSRSPVILLPQGIEATLSKVQLDWVLLHELAHVRRRDVWAVAFQRLVEVLYFFNPAVWIANSVIDQLREYACDDLAVSVSQGSSIDFGQAFLRILQRANETDPQLSGALGVFGFDSRAACFDRVRRLLDGERTISASLDRNSVAGLLLLAIAVLPRLNAADTGEKPKPPAVAKEAEKATKAGDLAKDVGQFELQVVGPNHKPIPGASVFFYTEPLPTAEQVRVGTFDKAGENFGVYITCDPEGRIVLGMPSNPVGFEVGVEIPGYGPYRTRWSSEDPSQQIPAKFTVQLEEGWTVGGLVVDPDGRPIEGVDVRPNIEFQRRKDDPRKLHSGRRVKTDADGKWRFESVPVSMNAVTVELNQSRFVAKFATLSRSDFELKPNQQPNAPVTLVPGVAVVGKVVDDHDRPIEGARIFTQYLNAFRETVSGEDGTYKLEGCQPVMSKIVVSAAGKARDMQQVRVGPEMDPVNFVMQPGGKIRVRVLDDHGNPAPKARIFFQRWRGDFFGYFEFDKVNQFADNEGVWEWDEAPLDAFQADICAVNCMQLIRQTLKAGEDEFVFRAPLRMVVSGKVIDAETKQPIKTFEVLPGFHNENDHVSWNNAARFTAKDGQYRYYPEHGRVAYIFRIEALGYRAYQSRDIRMDEGKVSIDVELKKAKEISATILTPSGARAAEAKIAVGIRGAQIAIKDGEFDKTSTYCGVQTADETGQLRVVAEENPFWLVILHPTGFFYQRLQPDEAIPSEITLTGWGRVEGVFRVCGKPVSQATIVIDQVGPQTYDMSGPIIYAQILAITDGKGRYRVDHVFPGQGKIGRQIVMMVGEGATEFTSTSMLPVTIEPEQTAQIDFGDVGRQVIGRFQSSDPNAKPDWKQYSVQMEPLLPELPALKVPNIPADIANKPDERQKWMDDWGKTDAGKAWLSLKFAHYTQEQLKKASPYYRATLNTKGEFRFDDIPAGEYKIYRLFSRTSQKLTVPATAEDRAGEPFDIGVLPFAQ